MLVRESKGFYAAIKLLLNRCGFNSRFLLP